MRSTTPCTPASTRDNHAFDCAPSGSRTGLGTRSPRTPHGPVYPHLKATYSHLQVGDEAKKEEAPPMCAALLDLLTSTSKWNDTLPALESLCAAQGRPHDLLLEIVRGGGSGGVDLSALKEEAEVRLRAQRTIKTKFLSTYVSLFPDVLEVSDMRHGRVSVRCRWSAADDGGDKDAPPAPTAASAPAPAPPAIAVGASPSEQRCEQEARAERRRKIATLQLQQSLELSGASRDHSRKMFGMLRSTLEQNAREEGSPAEGSAGAGADARAAGERAARQERRDRLEHAAAAGGGGGGVPLRVAGRGQCLASAEAEMEAEIAAAMRKAAEAEAVRAAAAAEAERAAAAATAGEAAARATEAARQAAKEVVEADAATRVQAAARGRRARAVVAFATDGLGASSAALRAQRGGGASDPHALPPLRPHPSALPPSSLARPGRSFAARGAAFVAEPRTAPTSPAKWAAAAVGMNSRKATQQCPPLPAACARPRLPGCASLTGALPDGVRPRAARGLPHLLREQGRRRDAALPPLDVRGIPSAIQSPQHTSAHPARVSPASQSPSSPCAGVAAASTLGCREAAHSLRHCVPAIRDTPLAAPSPSPFPPPSRPTQAPQAPPARSAEPQSWRRRRPSHPAPEGRRRRRKRQGRWRPRRRRRRPSPSQPSRHGHCKPTRLRCKHSRL